MHRISMLHFLEQYGIDLTQEHDLHWWRFKAMFDSLSEKTQFVKIMGYRSMTITKRYEPTAERVLQAYAENICNPCIEN